MYKNKISAVYKITNIITGDFYIGSSKNVLHRWTCHKCPSNWKHEPNKQLYQDMQKYGADKFRLQILAPVEPENLTQVEQEFIEMLHPTYNKLRAKGLDVDRHKEYLKNYYQSDKGKKYYNNYQNQLCFYNGETLTLNTLAHRFYKAGVEHPYPEAKKYLLH